jgi:lysophospholipase L1-like esterase
VAAAGQHRPVRRPRSAKSGSLGTCLLVCTIASNAAGAGATTTARPDSAKVGPAPARDAAPKALGAFQRSLENTRLRGSKTRILFFGDSHTASDCMTGRLRERLQAELGDGGPGFLMFGKPWPFFHHGREQVLEFKGLKPSHVRLGPEVAVLPLGLSGVAFNGGESEPISTEVRILGATVPAGRALQGEVWFSKQPNGATAELLLDGAPLATLATAGQPAPGYVDFTTDDGAHVLGVHAPAGAPLTLLGLVAELEGQGVVVDTLGVPGARARSQLYWEPKLFHEHLRRRAAALWVLAYGTNESTDRKQPIEEYAAQLRQVVDNLRAAMPEASCLLVGPTDFPERVKKDVYRERERTTQINQVQRSTAAQAGCAFFDTIALMGGPLSMLDWAKRDPPLGARDLVHLTQAGYQVVGDAIADAILPGPPSQAQSRGASK